jgi:hypothetical protein
LILEGGIVSSFCGLDGNQAGEHCIDSWGAAVERVRRFRVRRRRVSRADDEVAILRGVYLVAGCLSEQV